MIQWNEEYSEQHLLVDFSETDLDNIVLCAELDEKIAAIPCHNQNVERMIKLVSESATKRSSKLEREGFVHTVLASRSKLPRFETKKDFKVKWGFRPLKRQEDEGT